MAMAVGGIGPYLLGVRERHGYSSPERVQELARERGIHLRGKTLRNIEEGKVKRPDADTLQAVARFYDLDYQDLLRRAGYPTEVIEEARLTVTDDDAKLLDRLHRVPPRVRQAIEAILEEWERGPQNPPEA